MSYASLVKNNSKATSSSGGAPADGGKKSNSYLAAMKKSVPSSAQPQKKGFSVAKLYHICVGESVSILTKQGKKVTGILKELTESAFVFEDGQVSFAEMVSFRVVLADGSRTTRKGFRTDGEISGTKNTERQLQRFDLGSTANGVPGGEEDMSGQDGSWDQFELNRSQFGVKSTYKEEFYTTVIDRSDPEYSKNSVKAQQLANEILGQSSSNIHVREERDQITNDSEMDEEARFSTVLEKEPTKSVSYLEKVRGSSAKEQQQEEKVDKTVVASETAKPKVDASKSKLNPNAKSFSFNPKAADFTPRTVVPPQQQVQVQQPQPYLYPYPQQGYYPPPPQGYYGYPPQ